MAPNEVYQYSIVTALMDGVADSGLPVSTLLRHGDHGLGTFRHMVGEMIILDGVAYQMKSDGTVTTVDAGPDSPAVAPFAMTTHFRPERSERAALPDKAALHRLVAALHPRARNLYVAMRLRGRFRAVTVRTVGGQTRPRQGLAELGTLQTSHTFGDSVEGTVFGFRSPAYMQGVSVAGDHLHFLSADRARGGHVLALASDGEVTVETAPMAALRLELPVDDDEFNEAKLEADAAGIVAVEG